MEKLTLEQLAPYLPYNPKIEILNHEMDYTGIKESTINGYYFIGDSLHVTYKGGNTGKSSDEFKLKLLPISCLTKEITHNGETFIPIVELAKIAFPDRCWEIDGNGVAKAEYFDDPIQFWYSHMAKGFCNNWKPYTPNQYQLFQKLAEWKINFTLIPEHLYIDADTLENNPYK